MNGSYLARASRAVRRAAGRWEPLSDAVRAYTRLCESQAQLFLRPDVLLQFERHRREAKQRPLLMQHVPSSVEIELTNRCNLACVQCLRSQGLKPYALGDMRFDDYRRILAQFPRALSVCLNGFGEPLLHPEFLDVVRYTREVVPWAKVVIYSNGTLLDAGLAERVVGSGLTEVNVSIDASTPETYRRVRRGGKLEVVHENVRGLLRRRRLANAKLPLVGLNFVMLNDNEGELAPFIDQAAELGVDFVNCVSYATYDWGFQNLRSRASYRKDLALARARLDALGLECRTFPSDDLSWAEGGHPFDCAFFWGSSLRITWDGELTLGCCTPFKETYSYGNVLRTPFRELWNGPAFQQNRALARRAEAPNSICSRCQEQCRGFFSERDPALVTLRRRRA